MIISHSHKFIFIHVYKTAGTSIRKQLAPYNHANPSSNIIHRLINPKENIYTNKYEQHISAAELKSKLPANIWSNYYKFSFVRNPWDWHVSLYMYMKRTKDVHAQGAIIDKISSFEEYVDWRVNKDVHLQKEYVYNMETNTPLVNYIGKLETIQQDFDKICKQVGLPQCTLSKENVSNQKDYRTYYTPTTQSVIAEVYKDDIDTFGYSF